MSPRFEFDPSQDTTTIPVFPKDSYEFQVGEPKSFSRTNAQGNPSFGVRYPLTVMEGQYKGKRTWYSTYYQSEGGRAMAKVFLMAVNGYKRNSEEEERFNQDFAGQDWSFNPEDGSVGDAFRSVTGKRVRGDLDVQPAKDREGNLTGEENQQFNSWHPISAEAAAV